MPTKPASEPSPAAFVAWTGRTGRADEIAEAIGGIARRFTGGRFQGRSAPVRYAVNTVATLVWLRRIRPRAVIVQNPPTPAALVAFLYGRLAATPVLLDSHPSSFGRKGSRRWAAFVPLHRWLARRVDVVLVTVEDLAEEVRRWGGRALVVHEAPPLADIPAAPPPARDHVRVLFVGVFAGDEPVDAVVAAARDVPAVTVAITGDLDAAPGALVRTAPANVEFAGFLRGADYTEALLGADVVMALTTEPVSVLRAGYEAVYARRPLIVSNTPALREVFPHAIHTGNSPDEIAAALRAAIGDLGTLRASAPAALAAQRARWDAQRDALLAAVAQGPTGRRG